MTTKMQAWKQPPFNENVTVHQIMLLLTKNPGGLSIKPKLGYFKYNLKQVAEPIVV